MQKKQYLFREEGAWALNHLSLGSRGASAWNQFVEGLFAIFERAFSHEVDIVVHKLDNMRNRTYERVGNRRTISIDPCVPGQINIGTSRIFLPGGIRDLGVGARPGFNALEEQVKRIPPGEYVLLEDDIFSGGTIAQILRFLETHGICVTEIITGIQVGTPNLTVRVTPIERYSKEEIVDLNDPRDFLAGSNCGGLVIRHHDGNLSRAPYILPFVDTAERSSIPRSEVLSTSLEIWRLNIEFWARFPDVVLADADPFFRAAVSRWGHIPTILQSSVQYPTSLLGRESGAPREIAWGICGVTSGELYLALPTQSLSLLAQTLCTGKQCSCIPTPELVVACLMPGIHRSSPTSLSN